MSTLPGITKPRWCLATCQVPLAGGKLVSPEPGPPLTVGREVAMTLKLSSWQLCS